jgi:hypothetical protein
VNVSDFALDNSADNSPVESPAPADVCNMVAMHTSANRLRKPRLGLVVVARLVIVLSISAEGMVRRACLITIETWLGLAAAKNICAIPRSTSFTTNRRDQSKLNGARSDRANYKHHSSQFDRSNQAFLGKAIALTAV